MRAALLAVVLALAACGDDGKNLSGANQVAPPGQAPAPPAANPHGGDPHAGMGLRPAASAAPAPVAWTVPAAWKQSPPSSGMRMAQFDVGTDEAGDAVQCIVFGGIGGTDEQNIERWTGQMGAAAKDAAVVSHSDHDGLKVTRFESHGAYTDSMRPGEPKTIASATMLAAIVEAPGGAKLQVKLVGSKTVVDPAAKAFDEFLASMKPK
jgi:hypothetical protein